MGATQGRIELLERALGIPGLVLLGRYHTHQAQKPLALHSHPGCAEFVVVIKGRERYASAGEEVAVNGGEVYFTPPDRPHGSASAGQGISDFIWFQLRIVPDGFLGLSPDAASVLLARLHALRRPKWRTDDACLSRLAECVRHAATGDPAWRGYVRALFLACLERMLLQAEAEDRAETASRDEAQERADAMARVIARMEQADLEPPTLEALASMAGLSLSRFKEVFRRTVGRTPREYVNECRIRRAGALLAEGKSVTETAMALGFSGSDYFAVVFRRHTAMTPTEYVASCRRREKASPRKPEGCH